VSLFAIIVAAAAAAAAAVHAVAINNGI